MSHRRQKFKGSTCYSVLNGNICPAKLSDPAHTHGAAEGVLQQAKVMNYKTTVDVEIRLCCAGPLLSTPNLKMMILRAVISLGIFITSPLRGNTPFCWDLGEQGDNEGYR